MFHIYFLGIAGKADDDLPYATLSYANGKEYSTSKLNCFENDNEITCSRYNISQDDMGKYLHSL
jgi:hypothetical protein